MAHPPAERVELPHTWIKSRQEWLDTTECRLAWVTYVMDAGSVLVYMMDERGRRWDLFLESPGRGGRQLEVRIKFDAENDASFRVQPGSSEEAHLLAQLRHAQANTRIMKDHAGDVVARWIERRDRKESLDAIEKEGVVVHVTSG